MKTNNRKDYTGYVSGFLTAKYCVGSKIVSGKSRSVWMCECVCGQTIEVSADDLTRKGVTQCGCKRLLPLWKKVIQSRPVIPNPKSSPSYSSWANMKHRCSPEAKGQKKKDYYDNGITVCARWLNFPNFLEDMGEKPSKEYTIERIDNNKNYEPGNCKWATRLEQNRNKKSNRYITIDGEVKTLAEWFSVYKIQKSTFYYRKKTHGWDDVRAMTTPTNRRKKHD